MEPAYRLLRIDPKYLLPKTLFHPWKGTRRLPLDIPIHAEKGRVWNPGGKTGPGFLSGWHLLKSKKETEKYLKRFVRKEDIVICQILAKDLRPKPNSKVLLADTILIPEQDWLNAIENNPYIT